MHEEDPFAGFREEMSIRRRIVEKFQKIDDTLAGLDDTLEKMQGSIERLILLVEAAQEEKITEEVLDMRAALNRFLVKNPELARILVWYYKQKESQKAVLFTEEKLAWLLTLRETFPKMTDQDWLTLGKGLTYYLDLIAMRVTSARSAS